MKKISLLTLALSMTLAAPVLAATETSMAAAQARVRAAEEALAEARAAVEMLAAGKVDLSVAVPSVTVPSVTVPSVAVPSVTVSSVTVPSVTVPSVTVPSVTVPSVTVPSVTVPSVAPPPADITPCPCPQAFAGFTLGGTIGYGGGSAQSSVSHTITSAGSSGSANDPGFRGFSGLDGGIITGYLQRMDNWGAGVDFLANWMSCGSTVTSSNAQVIGGAGTGAQNVSRKVNLNSSLQVRGVLSYVISNLVMPKIMLGWDNSQYSLNFQSIEQASGAVPNLSPFVSLTPAKRLNGFLWGAGVDFLVAQNVVFGLEYTGVQSGKMTFSAPFNSGVGPETGTATGSFKPQYNSFKGTLKYVF